MCAGDEGGGCVGGVVWWGFVGEVVGGVRGRHDGLVMARGTFKARRIADHFIITLSAHVAAMSEWHLQPETEYRFELDPSASLAIKVPRFLPARPSLTLRSSCADTQRSLVQSSQRANPTSLARNARPPSSPGAAAPSR